MAFYRFLRDRTRVIPNLWMGLHQVSKEIEAEAALENCRALIKQIVADLSGERPFADETSATELLSYLERAASALKKSVSRS